MSENLKKVLFTSLSSNKNEQDSAELELLKLSKINGFTTELFKILVDSETSLNIKLAGAIYLKNMISLRINKDDLPQEDCEILKQNLLEAITRAPAILRVQLSVVLSKFVNRDFPHNWSKLFPSVVDYLNSNDMVKIYGALVALKIITKTFSETEKERSQKVINQLVPNCFPILSNLFKYLLSQNSENFSSMRHIILKIFWNTLLAVDVPVFLKKKENFDEWMTILIKSFQLEIPQDSPYESPYWKNFKWLTHILYRIYILYIYPERYEEKIDQDIAEYFNTEYSMTFLKFMIAIVQSSIKGSYVPIRVLTMSIYYIDNSIQSPVGYKAIEPQIETFFPEVIFPLLCFNQDDAELWINDPHEYIKVAFDISFDFYSAKVAAANVLLTLSKLRPKTAPVILKFLNQKMVNHQKEQNFYVKEGVLYCIGLMKASVRKLLKNSLETLLITHIIPELFNKIHPYLRSRACWVLSKFVNIQWQDKKTFTAGLEGVIQCIQDKDLPVKIEASVTLSEMIKSKLCYDDLEPLLGNILKAYLGLMNEIENDYIVKSLDLIIETYGEKIEPYALDLCRSLSEKFIGIVKEFPEMDDDEEMANSAIAYTCLLSIQTILDAVSSKFDILKQLEETLKYLIQTVLESENLDFLEEGTKIFTYLTFYQPTISSDMWLIFDVCLVSFDKWAYDNAEYFLPSFDNMISKDSKNFTSQRIEKVLSMCKGIFQKQYASKTEVECASKLISVILLNNIGRIDYCLPHFLETIISRLSQEKSKGMKILLLDNLSDALTNNAGLTINYMESQKCTLNVFGIWFKNLSLFKRVLDLKCAIIGLTQILSLDLMKLPASLQNNLHQIFSGVLNLIMNIDMRRKEAEKQKAQYELELKQFEQEKQRKKDLGEYYSDEEDDSEGEEDMDSILSEMQRIREFEEEKELEESDMNLEEEHETFTSPLDNINEIGFFSESVKKISIQYPDILKSIINKLGNQEKSILSELMK
eukprot:gene8673-620_t